MPVQNTEQDLVNPVVETQDAGMTDERRMKDKKFEEAREKYQREKQGKSAQPTYKEFFNEIKGKVNKIEAKTTTEQILYYIDEFCKTTIGKTIDDIAIDRQRKIYEKACKEERDLSATYISNQKKTAQTLFEKVDSFVELYTILEGLDEKIMPLTQENVNLQKDLNGINGILNDPKKRDLFNKKNLNNANLSVLIAEANEVGNDLAACKAGIATAYRDFMLLDKAIQTTSYTQGATSGIEYVLQKGLNQKDIVTQISKIQEKKMVAAENLVGKHNKKHKNTPEANDLDNYLDSLGRIKPLKVEGGYKPPSEIGSEFKPFYKTILENAKKMPDEQ
jgi:DNA-binding FrmR family transcriptional regulator